MARLALERKKNMRRWIARLSSFALMLVIPVVGWSEYLSYGAKRHWFDYRAAARGLWTEPARSWIVATVMLVIALLGYISLRCAGRESSKVCVRSD